MALPYLPASWQVCRQSEIEMLTGKIYSATEFRQETDSLQMTIEELCDYHVIFPIRKPLCFLSGFGMRWHLIYKVLKFHMRIDMPEAKSTPVYATNNGPVIRKGYGTGMGVL